MEADVAGVECLNRVQITVTIGITTAYVRLIKLLCICFG